jgi:hypothetical protein
MQLGLYQHYNGNYYQVIGLARHSESLEEMVVYRGLYGDYGLWVRPKTMFEEIINHNNQKRPRFEFIKALDVQAPALR